MEKPEASNGSGYGPAVVEFWKGNHSTANTEFMSIYSLIAWSVLHILISASAVVGNVLIIAVFVKRQRVRTRMNFVIIGLAFSDLLIALVIIPLWLTVLWLYYTQKSAQANYIQRIFGPLDIFCGMLSILHLMVISLERLHAISFPLSHRSLRAHVNLIVISAVWFLSAIIAVTSVFIPKGFQWKGTFIIYTCIGFFVPFTVICFAYVSLTLLVKNRHEQLRRMHTELTLRRERKLALTSFFIVLLFVVTWLPFFSINLMFYVCTGCAATISYHAVLAVKALHYSGSALNTVVYAARISEFRRPMMNLLTERRWDKRVMSHYRRFPAQFQETEV